MTITLTQPDATRPPVHVVVAGLPTAAYPGALTGIVQRSTDGVTYKTVRGAVDDPLDVVAGFLADDMSVAGSAGWGVASTGAQAWTVAEGTAANFSKASGTARVSMSALNTNHRIDLDTTATDQDATIYFTLPALITGSGGAAIIDLRVRVDSTLNHIRLRVSFLQTGAVTVSMTRSLTAGTTSLGTMADLVATAGHTYGLRLSAIGRTVQGKVWDHTLLAGVQPAAFSIMATNVDNVNSGTKISVFAFLNSSVTNALPYVFAFDNLLGYLPVVVVDDYEFRPGVVNTYRAGLMQQIADTFTGTGVSTWGTATTLQTWDTANAAFNKSLGVATIVHASANTEFQALISSPSDIGDCRMSATVFSTASSITGADAEFSMRAHVLDSNNRYELNVAIATTGVMTLRCFARFGGSTTTLESTVIAVTYADTKRYRVEFDIRGARLRMRVWDPVATPAPDWQVDEIVPAGLRISGGKSGLASLRTTSNSNANLTFAFDDFVVDTGTPTYLFTGITITPDLAGFWLCSTMRSFLNMAPRVVGYEEPSRGDRGGSAYIAGRTLPIAQNELASARTWTLTLRVPSLTAARQLEYVIASGDVFYLQTPADCPIPFGYYRVGQMGSERAIRNGTVRYFELPLQECAAPGPDVATASATWDTVIALYGSWPAVVAAQVSWETLLQLIGSPSEVIVE